MALITSKGTMDKENPAVWHMMGYALISLNRLEEAEQALADAAHGDEDNGIEGFHIIRPAVDVFGIDRIEQALACHPLPAALPETLKRPPFRGQHAQRDRDSVGMGGLRGDGRAERAEDWGNGNSGHHGDSLQRVGGKTMIVLSG